jgi:hypothetical protein
MVERSVDVAAVRRRAGVVAAVAGLLSAPYFWLFSAIVGWPGSGAPPPSAPVSEFVDFYVDGSTEIPLVATIAVGSWVIWLTLVVAVVRAACRRLDLAAILAVTMAGASTAVYVAAEGVLAWPTIGLTAGEVSENLDPGVAQAMVLSRDGLHAAAGVLLGVSMLVVAWLLARSDLWGHWLLAGLGAVAGVSACTSMIVGPEGFGAGAVLLWGIVVGVVVLIGLRRDPGEEGT